MAKRFFTLETKKSICDEAYLIPDNIKGTARLYSVSPAQIRRWKKRFMEEDSDIVNKKLKNGVKTFHQGREFVDKNVQDDLEAFFEGERGNHGAVTIKMMCMELVRLTPALNGASNLTLVSRIRRFLASRNIVQRRTTHVAQNTRYDDTLMKDFVKRVNQLIVSHDINCVVNMDETNVHFDMPRKRTLARRGSRTISMKTTGSPSRATVMLAVTMHGEKLKPLAIFKATPDGRISREFRQNAYPRNMAYATQVKAWTDVDVFMKWIKCVWKPFCLSRQGRPTLLIMDSFSVHKTAEVLQKLQSCGTAVEIIPAGYTAKLQVLDVGINKPFKDYVSENYVRWVRTHPGQKAKRPNVATWVKSSWECITEATIVNTWKGIGFEKD